LAPPSHALPGKKQTLGFAQTHWGNSSPDPLNQTPQPLNP